MTFMASIHTGALIGGGWACPAGTEQLHSRNPQRQTAPDSLLVAVIVDSSCWTAEIFSLCK